ncbi:response regulator [Hoeflea sp.]|uniref:response regulator n=1 Tax=Hoeflea sp. TaxID=1940281 RepID=UPI003747EE40
MTIAQQVQKIETAYDLSEATFVMVDDNVDEIFLTRRKVRRDGIVNRFVSERRPEKLFDSLDELIGMGVEKSSFMILLDVNMPRITGFELLKKIRNHPDYKETPVIMFSASNDEADIFEAMELGSDGYIVKPFTSEEFFAALTGVPRVKKRLLM